MRRFAVAAVAVLLLAGCSAEPAPAPAPPPPAPAPSDSAAPPAETGIIPTGEVTPLVGGLAAPWSVVLLDNGSTLVSERDTGAIRELTDGALREVGIVPGVDAGGEGGLLGLAHLDGDLYAYFTSADDSRIVRFTLDGAPGSYALGAASDILTSIPKAGNHNGGRIAFGPDGMLYATTGDAGDTASSPDVASLAGKILRMTPDGVVPDDNPMPGSLVYSLGHRNPQGITWDDSGRLWAAEFGQNTWDELNLIEPGADYGWPAVEGVGGATGVVDPVQQWTTDVASPSGLAWVRGTLFMAGLGGERLWSIDPATGAATEHFTGEFGRIRDVIAGPDGSLWLLTNNTDGRGDPGPEDDRLLQVELG